MPNIVKSKRGSFQQYESNLTYADRNSPKNFDGGEIKEVLRYRQEVLDDTKTVDKINQDYIKTSERGLSGNTANTINTAQGDTSKNKVELSKLWKNGKRQMSIYYVKQSGRVFLSALFFYLWR